ncbi:putative LPS assembly protein LptD [Chitinophagaceae bacterium LWZ2-11]
MKNLTVFDTVPAKNKTSGKNKNIAAEKNKNQSDTTLKSKKDSVTVDTLHISKDSLDAPVKYEAQDSGVLIIPTKQFLLYGKANAKYKDVNLDAGVIKYDQETQTIQAYGGTDTAKNDPLNKAKLNQGDQKSMSDTIHFNLKSLKGLTRNTYYQEQEYYVHAEVLKKISATEYYGYRNRFTTCNLDTPHYAFRTRKMKMVAGKVAVSGPSSAEFEGVPIPIGIPFGIFPLSQGRHSGIIVPTFTVSEQYGLGLEGMGYYKVVNDYWDVLTRANLYSYGGWSLNVNPKYQKRYRYSGSFNITIQNTKAINEVSYSPSPTQAPPQEFNVTKSYMINWSHTQDTRSRPGTTFGANVNFGSTKYNSTILNNPYANYQNQLSSSINYSKDFRGKANISLTANHNQNANTHLVNVSLPNLTANVVTFFPFQKKEQVGEVKWYEKLGIGYSGNISNQFAFYDTAFSLRKMLDTAQWGASHSIPITLSLPALGPVTIAPSVSFGQRWYGQQIIRSWDTAKGKVDTTINKGFYLGNQMSFGVSANTRIFGTYQFKHASGIQAIRHEIRPSIGFSYTPDLASKYYYNTRVDSAGHVMRFSKFDGVIPGAFQEGNFGGISFGLDNLLEMKVKSKTDTSASGIKKVKLLDGFGVNSSYNLLADSFALAPFNFYARSTLFGKVNITAGFILDPYQDSAGYRKNRFAWQGGGFNLGRITSGNLAISTQFKSKARDGKEKKDSTLPIDPFMTPDEQQRQLQFARSNPAEFTDFDIPWTLSLSYSLNFVNQLKADYSGYYTQITSSINFNGDFSLTPKWKVGGTGYINVNAGGLQQLSMFITRDLHCWQLAINVTPMGLFRSFSITINPKSGILRDLRINRSRTFSNY